MNKNLQRETKRLINTSLRQGLRKTKLHPLVITVILLALTSLSAGLLSNVLPIDGSTKSGRIEALTNIESGDVMLEFTPGNAETLIIALLNSAEERIRIASYSFTSKPIAEALVAARDRGVDIKVVMDKSNRTSQYSSATFLKNQRIPVRINERYAIMHNKVIVVDDKHTKTGSFNYSKAAATRNAENVLVLYDIPEIAGRYTEEWQRLWDEAEDY